MLLSLNNMYENQTRAACVLTACKQPKGSAPWLLEYNIYQFVLWCSARVVWLSHYPGLHNLSLCNLNTATLTKSQQDWQKHDREGGSLGWPVNADMYFRLLFFLAKKQPETQCISASATCYSEDWHLAWALNCM